MSKTFYVRPISGSNYVLNQKIIKIPVVDQNNNNLCLTYPRDKKLVPDEYMQKNGFSEVHTWLNSGWDKVWWTVEGDKENSTIKAKKIEGDWVIANNYLSKEYPSVRSSKTTKLNIKEKGLVGTLNLADFPFLEEVNCKDNYLSNLILPTSVKKVNAENNCLQSVNNLNCNWNSLAVLNLNNNPLNVSELINTLVKLKAIADKPDRTPTDPDDKDEQIHNLKQQLDKMSSDFEDATNANFDWAKKYQTLQEELQTKKSKDETHQQNSNLTVLWDNTKYPVLAIGVVVGGYFMIRRILNK